MRQSSSVLPEQHAENKQFPHVNKNTRKRAGGHKHSPTFPPSPLPYLVSQVESRVRSSKLILGHITRQSRRAVLPHPRGLVPAPDDGLHQQQGHLNLARPAGRLEAEGDVRELCVWGVCVCINKKR